VVSGQLKAPTEASVWSVAIRRSGSAFSCQLYSEVSTFIPMTIVGSFEAIRHTSSGSAQGWRIEQY
jgi:hypothetical protein